MGYSIKKAVFWVVLMLATWPAVNASAQNEQSASGFPVIASRHKHTPSGKEGVRSAGRGGARDISIVATGRAKRKPAKQRLALSPVGRRGRISSKTAIVIDAQTGKTVYSMRAGVARQPASTIKVLTGLIALNSLKKTDMVPTSRRAANMPRSKIYLKRGKSYVADDLINAVLMASANDASVALAEKIAGSERAFAKLMTSKASALGARKTVCKSATGLTRRGQQSTAKDLALIFDNAMQDEEFAKRMALKKVKTRHGTTLRTHNKALWQVVGAEGGKTGYTRAARQTYVGKFRRGQDELLVAIMGSETMWEDVNFLVEYGFGRLQRGDDRVAAQNQQVGGTQVVSMKRIAPEPLAALKVLSDTKKLSKL